MMAYELIFGSIPIISLFIISVLIILVKLKKIIIIRAFAFNFTIFLSTLYYFFFIIKFGFNLYIYLSFLLELIFLMGYIYLFKSFFINFEKHNINYDTVKKRLKNLLYIYNN